MKEKPYNYKLISLFSFFISISIMVLFTYDWRYDFSYSAFHLRKWYFLIATFSGGALGVAGLLLQKLTKNLLADISILGIGSLNIVSILLYLIFIFNGTQSDLENAKLFLPIISIISSIFGTFIIYQLSNKTEIYKNNNFIIIGIALSFLFESISVGIINLINNNSTIFNGAAMAEINNYSYGRFGDIEKFSQYTSWFWITIISFLVITFICVIVHLFSEKLNVIEMSEELAKTHSINVNALKKLIFFFVALLAGIESYLLGTIAVLGIIAPNISILIFGNNASLNVITTFIIGALLALVATFISININGNIPVGIISTAAVIPIFIYLIYKK